MIKFIWKQIKRFFWDEKSAPASIRAIGTFIATTGGFVIASASDATGEVNFDVIGAWGPRQWALRIGVGLAIGFFLRMKSGEKNENAEEVIAKLKEAGYHFEKPTFTPPTPPTNPAP